MKENLFKVLIIGDPSVGKTSFVRRYVNDQFSRDYKGTIGVDFALKVINWSPTDVVKLQLWDIAGQERFTNLTRVYYRNAHACVLMFDLTDRKTFEGTLKWKNDLDSKVSLPNGSSIPCLLLGNKCDLNNRQVEQEEIERLSNENDFLGWSDISVKENLMVTEPMRFLVTELMTRCRPRTASETALSSDETSATTAGRRRNQSTPIRIKGDGSKQLQVSQSDCRC